MKILILGHTGLLGNIVHKFLSTRLLEVMTIDSTPRWPSVEFKQAVIMSEPTYIVNCIGAIHQRTSEFSINFELPMWLDSLGARIIHPGTDCESDADSYGISKRRARDFIVEQGRNTKSIKTSIIGPEIHSTYSLFSWLLSQPDSSTVKGFANQYWNGNTTLTWARVCVELINNWDSFEVETIIRSNCISKYELLRSIANVFDKNITIVPTEVVERDKCLEGTFTESIYQQLVNLKEFMNENH